MSDTQKKQREHYKKLVTIRYLGHQDYLGGYYEAPTKEDFIEGIVDLIESAKREELEALPFAHDTMKFCKHFGKQFRPCAKCVVDKRLAQLKQEGE